MWKNALTDCAWALSIQRAPIGTASHALCKNSKTKKTANKVDGIVAVAMASLEAVQEQT
jgi:hypothetical protein